MLRQLFVLGNALVLAAVLAVGGTAAPRAEQIHIALDESFPSAFWTGQCGVPVTVSNSGDLHVTLVRNKAGLIVRENDMTGGMKIEFSSPYGSFTFPSAPSQWDYGDGAVLGSPVVVTFTGLQGHVAGSVASDAGLIRFLGEVEGVDEFGIPMVEFGDVVLKDVGQRSTLEAVRAAICGALAP
jgi:hypothetical protein